MVRRRKERRAKLGQHFLADPNLLEAIIRDAEVDSSDVVLEVGGGRGVLTRRLAPHVSRLFVIEVDEGMRSELEIVARSAGNVDVVWGDAMKLGLTTFHPPPTKLVANLPYSIATPLLLRTIDEMPSLVSWTVMVQREVAERLVAAHGSRVYGAPSVLVQLACDVKLLRRVDRAVFSPAPRVDSALIQLRRRGAGAPEPLRRLVREGFAHRRKSLARSLEQAVPGRREEVRAVLRSLGLPPDARAEALAPEDFVSLALKLPGALSELAEEPERPQEGPVAPSGNGRPR
jgi:16S rRNA (adenine1518-N6/adenine1519-N6)-dimethyltransferase